ncbi:hypothetical protein LCDVSa018R [Lymphocystis disease virus 3]|uniref:Uncharacterized protein n=1 Tax=Lymphocystis disease virus 3 TaxID=2560566 RepID=A0A1B2RVS7_9VIRU|nr:hypothetical protein BZK12_gp018 [Lymphocystis disease virus Sa]AOC55102.1 hypothetical protein LCDVSa018R [Lymphocystis disease virus 3]
MQFYVKINVIESYKMPKRDPNGFFYLQSSNTLERSNINLLTLKVALK